MLKHAEDKALLEIPNKKVTPFFVLPVICGDSCIFGLSGSPNLELPQPLCGDFPNIILLVPIEGSYPSGNNNFPVVPST